ncbi:MAG: nucleotide-binding domain containing protein, partial [Pseudomonadota bacterium]
RELKRLLDWARGCEPGKPLLIASTAAPERVAEIQSRFGTENTARAVEDFLAKATAELVAELGIRRLVVAGGETSGAVVSALNVPALRIGPEIDPGVPWTETLGTPRLALALKSGNFGGEDFFMKALGMLQ